MSTHDNADKIQSVINDDLFPNVQHVSDVKQVLAFMSDYAAPFSEDQVRALLLLESMGNNTRLHPEGNPYKTIIKQIKQEFKKSVARPETFLRTIEELIPKPPKPIIMADGRAVRGGRG
ncbi:MULTISPECIES: hypothetical protein [Paenibacillus]|jgi:hypothetical protein|uniref:hypothetical protein n=1 Tax=Paenibacillus TaxID=44249 RepID=UPI000EECDBCC|nr:MULTISPECIES: hypothetical protein [Paenibacillus]KAF6614223.1 hypothetical protein HFE00_25875 [Paenibacillus sp. EKM101P]KAF6616581.1 hypothetical protein HFE03_25845 [Paenibacillus sp. EKM102P]KAF6625045.1 hypothetical protein HFE01_26045 [Paenibacillus sp. EKM10P]KAF6640873.1 hypothetical protein HFE02_25860 [Paenibacillus sp. EKM11P]MEE4565921.1 hypothetical protein [Paenibacillus polymyxa]